MGKVIVRGKDAQRKAVEIVKNGGTLEDAVEATGYGRNYVRQLCKASNVYWKGQRYRDTGERIEQLARDGLTAQEIADLLDYTSSTVLKYAREKNISVKEYRGAIGIKERHEAMRKYKAEGHTMGEVAEQFGVSITRAQDICKGIAPQKDRRPTKYRNQFTIDEAANIERVKKIIEERCGSFEYAGNYTGSDGYADIRCKVCGTVVTRSYVSIRHGTATCEVCEKNAIEQRRIERKKAEEKERERVAEQKRREKALGMMSMQLSFKKCPICGELFYSSKTYCSKKCREQNKWHMKEGYRNLFPLEEVFKRDNGICYLCGKPCDWTDYKAVDGARVYGDFYPSRDHVIPKSKGGMNAWENIRLAHRICNSVKWASLPLGQKNGA